jgi:hypothetical protein
MSAGSRVIFAVELWVSTLWTAAEVRHAKAALTGRDGDFRTP